MENKPIINKPKFLSIKLFLFSFSVASILWIWGLISAQDLINTSIQNYNASLGQGTVSAAPSTLTGPAASTSLRKVQLPATPTPGPALPVINQPARQRSAPLTNTGSSRP